MENFENSRARDWTCFQSLYKSYSFAVHKMGISNVVKWGESLNCRITLQGHILNPPLETALYFWQRTPIHLSLSHELFPSEISQSKMKYWEKETQRMLKTHIHCRENTLINFVKLRIHKSDRNLHIFMVKLNCILVGFNALIKIHHWKLTTIFIFFYSMKLQRFQALIVFCSLDLIMQIELVELENILLWRA